jgi:hypothetical protein
VVNGWLARRRIRELTALLHGDEIALATAVARSEGALQLLMVTNRALRLAPLFDEGHAEIPYESVHNATVLEARFGRLVLEIETDGAPILARGRPPALDYIQRVVRDHIWQAHVPSARD